MNRKTSLFEMVAALAAGFLLASCGPESQAVPGDQPATAMETLPAPGPAETKAPPPPDAKRILVRAAERWDHITHGDWIQAYDFLAPEIKQSQKLGGFLQGKDDFDYRDPSKPRLVAIDGDQAYTAIEVVWTPLHEVIRTADNVPPEGVTQVLAVVETWVWQDGEWFWTEITRSNEFFRAHPELAERKDPVGTAARKDGISAPGQGEE